MRLGRLRFESKYLAIQHFHKEKNWSIRWMCRQLNITKAAYYKWLHRTLPKAEQENMQLAELVREYDDKFNHIPGYRRMTAWINHFNGTFYGKNRIYRIMKALNVHSVIRRKQKKYSYVSPETTAENVLKRDLQMRFFSEMQLTNTFIFTTMNVFRNALTIKLLWKFGLLHLKQIHLHNIPFLKTNEFLSINLGLLHKKKLPPDW